MRLTTSLDRFHSLVPRSISSHILNLACLIFVLACIVKAQVTVPLKHVQTYHSPFLTPQHVNSLINVEISQMSSQIYVGDIELGAFVVVRLTSEEATVTLLSSTLDLHVLAPYEIFSEPEKVTCNFFTKDLAVVTCPMSSGACCSYIKTHDELVSVGGSSHPLLMHHIRLTSPDGSFSGNTFDFTVPGVIFRTPISLHIVKSASDVFYTFGSKYRFFGNLDVLPSLRTFAMLAPDSIGVLSEQSYLYTQTEYVPALMISDSVPKGTSITITVTVCVSDPCKTGQSSAYFFEGYSQNQQRPSRPSEIVFSYFSPRQHTYTFRAVTPRDVDAFFPLREFLPASFVFEDNDSVSISTRVCFSHSTEICSKERVQVVSLVLPTTPTNFFSHPSSLNNNIRTQRLMHAKLDLARDNPGRYEFFTIIPLTKSASLTVSDEIIQENTTSIEESTLFTAEGDLVSNTQVSCTRNSKKYICTIQAPVLQLRHPTAYFVLRFIVRGVLRNSRSSFQRKYELEAHTHLNQRVTISENSSIRFEYYANQIISMSYFVQLGFQKQRSGNFYYGGRSTIVFRQFTHAKNSGNLDKMLCFPIFAPIRQNLGLFWEVPGEECSFSMTYEANSSASYTCYSLIQCANLSSSFSSTFRNVILPNFVHPSSKTKEPRNVYAYVKQNQFLTTIPQSFVTLPNFRHTPHGLIVSVLDPLSSFVPPSRVPAINPSNDDFIHVDKFVLGYGQSFKLQISTAPAERPPWLYTPGTSNDDFIGGWSVNTNLPETAYSFQFTIPAYIIVSDDFSITAYRALNDVTTVSHQFFGCQLKKGSVTAHTLTSETPTTITCSLHLGIDVEGTEFKTFSPDMPSYSMSFIITGLRSPTFQECQPYLSARQIEQSIQRMMPTVAVETIAQELRGPYILSDFSQSVIFHVTQLTNELVDATDDVIFSIQNRLTDTQAVAFPPIFPTSSSLGGYSLETLQTTRSEILEDLIVSWQGGRRTQRLSFSRSLGGQPLSETFSSIDMVPSSGFSNNTPFKIATADDVTAFFGARGMGAEQNVRPLFPGSPLGLQPRRISTPRNEVDVPFYTHIGHEDGRSIAFIPAFAPERYSAGSAQSTIDYAYSGGPLLYTIFGAPQTSAMGPSKCVKCIPITPPNSDPTTPLCNYADCDVYEGADAFQTRLSSPPEVGFIANIVLSKTSKENSVMASLTARAAPLVFSQDPNTVSPAYPSGTRRGLTKPTDPLFALDLAHEALVCGSYLSGDTGNLLLLKDNSPSYDNWILDTIQNQQDRVTSHMQFNNGMISTNWPHAFCRTRKIDVASMLLDECLVAENRMGAMYSTSSTPSSNDFYRQYAISDVPPELLVVPRAVESARRFLRLSSHYTTATQTLSNSGLGLRLRPMWRNTRGRNPKEALTLSLDSLYSYDKTTSNHPSTPKFRAPDGIKRVLFYGDYQGATHSPFLTPAEIEDDSRQIRARAMHVTDIFSSPLQLLRNSAQDICIGFSESCNLCMAHADAGCSFCNGRCSTRLECPVNLRNMSPEQICAASVPDVPICSDITNPKSCLETSGCAYCAFSRHTESIVTPEDASGYVFSPMQPEQGACVFADRSASRFLEDMNCLVSLDVSASTRWLSLIYKTETVDIQHAKANSDKVADNYEGYFPSSTPPLGSSLENHHFAIQATKQSLSHFFTTSVCSGRAHATSTTTPCGEKSFGISYVSPLSAPEVSTTIPTAPIYAASARVFLAPASTPATPRCTTSSMFGCLPSFPYTIRKESNSFTVVFSVETSSTADRVSMMRDYAFSDPTANIYPSIIPNFISLPSLNGVIPLATTDLALRLDFAPNGYAGLAGFYIRHMTTESHYLPLYAVDAYYMFQWFASPSCSSVLDSTCDRAPPRAARLIRRGTNGVATELVSAEIPYFRSGEYTVVIQALETTVLRGGEVVSATAISVFVGAAPVRVGAAKYASTRSAHSESRSNRLLFSITDSDESRPMTGGVGVVALGPALSKTASNFGHPTYTNAVVDIFARELPSGAVRSLSTVETAPVFPQGLYVTREPLLTQSQIASSRAQGVSLGLLGVMPTSDSLSLDVNILSYGTILRARSTALWSTISQKAINNSLFGSVFRREFLSQNSVSHRLRFTLEVQNIIDRSALALSISVAGTFYGRKQALYDGPNATDDPQQIIVSPSKILCSSSTDYVQVGEFDSDNFNSALGRQFTPLTPSNNVFGGKQASSATDPFVFPLYAESQLISHGTASLASLGATATSFHCEAWLPSYAELLILRTGQDTRGVKTEVTVPPSAPSHEYIGNSFTQLSNTRSRASISRAFYPASGPYAIATQPATLGLLPRAVFISVFSPSMPELRMKLVAEPVEEQVVQAEGLLGLYSPISQPNLSSHVLHTNAMGEALVKIENVGSFVSLAMIDIVVSPELLIEGNIPYCEALLRLPPAEEETATLETPWLYPMFETVKSRPLNTVQYLQYPHPSYPKVTPYRAISPESESGLGTSQTLPTRHAFYLRCVLVQPHGPGVIEWGSTTIPSPIFSLSVAVPAINSPDITLYVGPKRSIAVSGSHFFKKPALSSERNIAYIVPYVMDQSTSVQNINLAFSSWSNNSVLLSFPPALFFRGHSLVMCRTDSLLALHCRTWELYFDISPPSFIRNTNAYNYAIVPPSWAWSSSPNPSSPFDLSAGVLQFSYTTTVDLSRMKFFLKCKIMTLYTWSEEPAFDIQEELMPLYPVKLEAGSILDQIIISFVRPSGEACNELHYTYSTRNIPDLTQFTPITIDTLAKMNQVTPLVVNPATMPLLRFSGPYLGLLLGKDDVIRFGRSDAESVACHIPPSVLGTLTPLGTIRFTVRENILDSFAAKEIFPPFSNFNYLTADQVYLITKFALQTPHTTIAFFQHETRIRVFAISMDILHYGSSRYTVLVPGEGGLLNVGSRQDMSAMTEDLPDTDPNFKYPLPTSPLPDHPILATSFPDGNTPEVLFLYSFGTSVPSFHTWDTRALLHPQPSPPSATPPLGADWVPQTDWIQHDFRRVRLCAPLPRSYIASKNLELIETLSFPQPSYTVFLRDFPSQSHKISFEDPFIKTIAPDQEALYTQQTFNISISNLGEMTSRLYNLFNFQLHMVSSTQVFNCKLSSCESKGVSGGYCLCETSNLLPASRYSFVSRLGSEILENAELRVVTSGIRYTIPGLDNIPTQGKCFNLVLDDGAPSTPRSMPLSRFRSTWAQTLNSVDDDTAVVITALTERFLISPVACSGEQLQAATQIVDQSVSVAGLTPCSHLCLGGSSTNRPVASRFSTTGRNIILQLNYDIRSPNVFSPTTRVIQYSFQRPTILGIATTAAASERGTPGADFSTNASILLTKKEFFLHGENFGAASVDTSDDPVYVELHQTMGSSTVVISLHDCSVTQPHTVIHCILSLPTPEGLGTSWIPIIVTHPTRLANRDTSIITSGLSITFPDPTLEFYVENTSALSQIESTSSISPVSTPLNDAFSQLSAAPLRRFLLSSERFTLDSSLDATLGEKHNMIVRLRTFPSLSSSPFSSGSSSLSAWITPTSIIDSNSSPRMLQVRILDNSPHVITLRPLDAVRGETTLPTIPSTSTSDTDSLGDVLPSRLDAARDLIFVVPTGFSFPTGLFVPVSVLQTFVNLSDVRQAEEVSRHYYTLVPSLLGFRQSLLTGGKENWAVLDIPHMSSFRYHMESASTDLTLHFLPATMAAFNALAQAKPALLNSASGAEIQAAKSYVIKLKIDDANMISDAVNFPSTPSAVAFRFILPTVSQATSENPALAKGVYIALICLSGRIGSGSMAQECTPMPSTGFAFLNDSILERLAWEAQLGVWNKYSLVVAVRPVQNVQSQINTINKQHEILSIEENSSSADSVEQDLTHATKTMFDAQYTLLSKPSCRSSLLLSFRHCEPESWITIQAKYAEFDSSIKYELRPAFVFVPSTSSQTQNNVSTSFSIGRYAMTSSFLAKDFIPLTCLFQPFTQKGQVTANCMLPIDSDSGVVVLAFIPAPTPQNVIEPKFVSLSSVSASSTSVSQNIFLGSLNNGLDLSLRRPTIRSVHAVLLTASGEESCQVYQFSNTINTDLPESSFESEPLTMVSGLSFGSSRSEVMCTPSTSSPPTALRVTLRGTLFKSSIGEKWASATSTYALPAVMIGSVPCMNVIFDPATPDTQLTCEISSQGLVAMRTNESRYFVVRIMATGFDNSADVTDDQTEPLVAYGDLSYQWRTLSPHVVIYDSCDQGQYISQTSGRCEICPTGVDVQSSPALSSRFLSFVSKCTYSSLSALESSTLVPFNAQVRSRGESDLLALGRTPPVNGLCEPNHIIERDVASPDYALCIPCGENTSSIPGDTYCKPCTSGYYRKLESPLECVACPAGTATYSSTLNLPHHPTTQCSPCAEGFYAPVPGLAECLPCLSGYTTSSTGAVECVACEPGYYKGSSEQTCVACPPQTFSSYSAAASCSRCSEAQGFYASQDRTTCILCDPPNTLVTNETTVSCVPPEPVAICTAGQFLCSELSKCPGEVLTSLPKCIMAPPGTYISSPSASEATPCPVNTYSPVEGSTACLPCSSNYSTNLAIRQTACNTRCPDGTFSFTLATDTVALASNCVSCNVGYTTTYPLDSEGNSNPASSLVSAVTCQACPAGFYGEIEQGRATCKLCPPDAISIFPGRTECTSCPRGRFADPTRTHCVMCQRDEIPGLPVNNAISCEKCQAGTFAEPGDAECLSCNRPGYMQQGAECIACPAGKYSEIEGNINRCIDCPISTFTPSSGLRKCTYCPGGTSTHHMNAQTGVNVGLGATACELCPAGKSRSFTDQPLQLSLCTACSQGFFSDEGASECTACPGGKYWATSSDSPEAMENRLNDSSFTWSSKMPPASAFFSNNANREDDVPVAALESDVVGVCNLCPAGKFSTNPVSTASGAFKCTECPMGFYTSGPGAVQCTVCPPGSYNTALGSTLCHRCVSGTFGKDGECVRCLKGTDSLEGATSCTTCDSGRFANEKIKGIAQTIAEITFYGRDVEYERVGCEACPKGTYSENGGLEPCLNCAVGKYQTNAGASTCQSCSLETFNREEGRELCDFCPPLYIGSFERTKCVCTEGYYTKLDSWGRGGNDRDGYPGDDTTDEDTHEGTDDETTNEGNNSMGETEDSYEIKSSFFRSTKYQSSFDLTAVAEPEEFEECSACPVGALCTLSNLYEDELGTLAGYWRTDILSTEFFVCLVKSHCLEVTEKNGNTESRCSPGRGSVLCGACSPGHYMNNMECMTCPSTTTTVIQLVFVFLLVFIVALLIIYAVAKGDRELPQAVEAYLTYEYSRTEALTMDGATDDPFDDSWQSSDKNQKSKFYNAFNWRMMGASAPVYHVKTSSNSPINANNGLQLAVNPLAAIDSDANIPSSSSSNFELRGAYKIALGAEKGWGLSDEELSTFDERNAKGGSLVLTAAASSLVQAEDLVLGIQKQRFVRPSILVRFKIIVTFFQIGYLVTSLVEIPWPDTLRSILRVFHIISFDLFQWTATACLYPFGIEPTSTYYPTFWVTMALPVVFVLVVFLCYGVPLMVYQKTLPLTIQKIVSFALCCGFVQRRGQKARDKAKAIRASRREKYANLVAMGTATDEELAVFATGDEIPETERIRIARTVAWSQVMKVSLFASFMVYPRVIHVAISLFHCRDVGVSGSFMVNFFSDRCYDDSWYDYIPYSSVALVLYGIGFPLVCFVLLYRGQKSGALGSPLTTLRLGLFYEAYLPQRWWFDAVDFIIKILLAIVAPFFKAQYQLAACTVVLLFYLGAMLSLSPYFRKGDDQLHLAVLAISMIIAYGGHTFQFFERYAPSISSGSGQGVSDPSSVAVIILVTYCIVLILGYFCVQIFGIIRSNKRARRREKDARGEGKAHRLALIIHSGKKSSKKKVQKNATKRMGVITEQEIDGVDEALANTANMAAMQNLRAGKNMNSDAGVEMTNLAQTRKNDSDDDIPPPPPPPSTLSSIFETEEQETDAINALTRELGNRPVYNAPSARTRRRAALLPAVPPVPSGLLLNTASPSNDPKNNESVKSKPTMDGGESLNNSSAVNLELTSSPSLVTANVFIAPSVSEGPDDGEGDGELMSTPFQRRNPKMNNRRRGHAQLVSTPMIPAPPPAASE